MPGLISLSESEEANSEDIDSEDDSDSSGSDKSASASALPPIRAVNRPRFAGYISVRTDDYPNNTIVYPDTLYLTDGVRKIRVPMAEGTSSPEWKEKTKRARERSRKSVPETTPEPHKSLTDSRASVAPALSECRGNASALRAPGSQGRQAPVAELKCGKAAERSEKFAVKRS